MNSLSIATSTGTFGMIIQIDADAFLRRRRIIELQHILPDIQAALCEVVSHEFRAELEDAKRAFEKELAELLQAEVDRMQPEAE